MKTTFISSNSITAATRLSLLKLQQQLADAQTEMTSARYADVGEALGYKTGQSISLRQEHSRLKTIVETNSIVSTRMNASQSALQNLIDNAQAFLEQIEGARLDTTNAGIVQVDAQTSFQAFLDSVNTAFNGGYLFGGVNSDVAPLTDYYASPAAANKQAVDNAFMAAFGISQSDPAVANISAADMSNFLDTTFSALFDDPSWSTDWSSASNQNVRNRISTSELVETSANANEDAFRKLAKAYTMVADLGIENLGEGAYQAVIDKAVEEAGDAIRELGEVQSKLGVSQARVANASERMSIQIDYLNKQVTALERVDPNEAATRVSALLTQLESSYELTARIMGLSILNYL